MKAEHISLYFCEGTSNKEYHVHLVEAKGGWMVNVEYGRRGQTLKAESKTKTPVEYEIAKEAYDKTVKAKTQKGYSLSEDGGVFQSPSMEERFSGILPQLLNDIEDTQLENLLLDKSYCTQEKHNGERRMLKKDGDTITGINKKGLAVALPMVLEEEARTLSSKQLVIDCEIIGTKIYVFDLLELNGKDLRELPYKEREALLKKHISKSKNIIPVLTAYSAEEKSKLFAQIKQANGEGVVLKKVDAHYSAGRPASGGSQLKFKFMATATVMVEAHHATKSSVEMVGFDEQGGKVKLGKLTIPPNKDMPKVGSFIEVEYLYAYKNGSIYQGIYLGERLDQDQTDCKISQLKYKPEEVVDVVENSAPKKVKKNKV